MVFETHGQHPGMRPQNVSKYANSQEILRKESHEKFYKSSVDRNASHIETRYI